MTLPFDEFREPVDHATWINLKDTSAFLHGDPIVDWLKEYGAERGFTPDHQKPDFIPDADFGRFMGRKSREFRQRVIEIIQKRLAEANLGEIVTIEVDPRAPAAVERTRQLIEAGVAGIAGAVLLSETHRYYGVADLLLRADVMNAVVDQPVPSPEIDPGKYVAINIRFRGFELNAADEATSCEVYSAQLALLNQALGETQGQMPKKAYFLGRRWKKGSKEKKQECRNCLDRLIPVTLPAQPQYRKDPVDYLERGLQAIAWLNRVREEGKDWQVVPEPTIPELRPDMKSDRDAPWHGAKKEIAAALNEPTVIWKVGPSARERLLQAGCADWTRPSFDLDLVIEKETETKQRLRRMLDVNRRSDGETPYDPERVAWSREEWFEREPLEFFVDFETTSNLDDDFSQLPEMGGQALIFMVGCGHWEYPEPEAAPTLFEEPASEPTWVFRVFYASELSEEAEGAMLREWYEYMDEVRRNTPNAPASPKVFHWSGAEPSSHDNGLLSAFQRHGEPQGWPKLNWYDFLENVVRPKQSSDAFVVRGAWGFGLKAIGKALHGHGLIPTLWGDGPADGLAAMGGSWECYRAARAQSCPVEEVIFTDVSGKPHRLFEEIIEYNQTDCRVMADCIRFIRSLG